MTFELLFLIAGLLFIVMALVSSVVRRLPISASMLYLAVGICIGPIGLELLDFDALGNAVILERVTEIAVLISLFTAGLKLRVDWQDRRWQLPFRLATLSMIATVFLVALAGVVGLGMSLGAAILLGAILAPTDPVLASDVQVADPQDDDQLRFALTGEAGLNDGTAFPFVLLGLGLLSHHELGSTGWRWFAVDVIWAVASGIGTGVMLGTAIGYLVLHLRRNHGSAVGLDDFLTLGLIALTYGGALLIHGYGFLAVFAAGLALRRLERRETGPELDHAIDAMNAERDIDDVATGEKTAPAYMAQALLGFNEQLERIGEVAVVVVVGALLFTLDFPIEAAWFIPVLFFVIRPAAVWIGLLGTDTPPVQRRLIGWFGLRGIGSLYYLLFAAIHGLESAFAAELAGLVMLTIAASVVLHGTSVTPLMVRYQQKVEDGSIDANAGPHRGIGAVS